jgi:hypothetical protein
VTLNPAQFSSHPNVLVANRGQKRSILDRMDRDQRHPNVLEPNRVRKVGILAAPRTGVRSLQFHIAFIV